MFSPVFDPPFFPIENKGIWKRSTSNASSRSVFQIDLDVKLDRFLNRGLNRFTFERRLRYILNVESARRSQTQRRFSRAGYDRFVGVDRSLREVQDAIVLTVPDAESAVVVSWYNFVASVISKLFHGRAQCEDFEVGSQVVVGNRNLDREARVDGCSSVVGWHFDEATFPMLGGTTLASPDVTARHATEADRVLRRIVLLYRRISVTLVRWNVRDSLLESPVSSYAVSVTKNVIRQYSMNIFSICNKLR